MPDVYYSPEKFGLEILHEAEYAGGYDFDKFVVWRHKETGQLYWATDSGCSCYSPFEGLGIDGLNMAANKHEILAAVYPEFTGTESDRINRVRAELIEKVNALA